MVIGLKSREKKLQDVSYAPAKGHFRPRLFILSAPEQEVSAKEALDKSTQFMYDERETDWIVRRATGAISSSDKGSIQRQEYSGPGRMRLEEVKDASIKPDLERAIQQALGGGQHLPDRVRQPMEQAFGTDFSRVRVHSDAEADFFSRSLQARAFTTGQDLFFKKGEYNPGGSEGQRLLAHELTHVVQQRSQTGASFNPSLIQRVVDWRALYQQCRQEVFGNRERLSWGGRRVPSLDVINLIIQVAGTGAGGYGPEDLAAVWAIESNFTRSPRNNQNSNGSVDIGPVQINYQANSPGMSERRQNGIFGTNLAGGEVFNGNIIANLSYGWWFLQRRGHEGYNPGSTRRGGAVTVLLPELRRLFNCMIAARTITFSEAEGDIVSAP